MNDTFTESICANPADVSIVAICEVNEAVKGAVNGLDSFFLVVSVRILY
jgi:hypothetical protein